MKFLNLPQEKDILHHITIRLYAEGFYSHGLSSERLSFLYTYVCGLLVCGRLTYNSCLISKKAG